MDVEIEAARKKAVLEQCLTSDEYSNLEPSVIKKIEIFFEDKFNDFLTARALAETEKTNYSKYHPLSVCKFEFWQKIHENVVS